MIRLVLPVTWSCPENYTLLSDFAPNPTGKPVHTLTRNKDRARILVDIREDAEEPGNLDDYFPVSQAETQDPTAN